MGKKVTEKKLSKTQACMVLALVRDREALLQENAAAIDELCAMFASDGMMQPGFEQRQDGIYIIDRAGQPALPEVGPAQEDAE